MRRPLILAASALLLVLSEPTANAGFMGAEFSAVYYNPNSTTVYPSATFTPSVFNVGAGQEADGNIRGRDTLAG